MSFAQMPEQTRVIEVLQRSLRAGRLSHAYLFSGSDLAELEALACTLAKALNCHHPVQPAGAALPIDCCDHCPSCRRIQEENHPDVQWVRPESKSRVITIDQVRELMHTVNLKPTEAWWKVGVIVAADRLNVQAANAFLKTLEEPPAKSILLLLSTEPARILETILSRCLRLNFAGETGPPGGQTCLNWLTAFSEAAAREGRGLLSRYRLLGSLLKALNEIKTETDKRLTAASPLERHNEIEPRLRDRWEDELSAAIEAEYRHRRGDVLVALQWWLRDVWLRTLGVGGQGLAFPTLEGSAEAVARRLSTEDALSNLEVLEQTQRLLATNVQEALALEVGLLKLKL